jgi:hypothetical protein
VTPSAKSPATLKKASDEQTVSAPMQFEDNRLA